MIGGQLMADVIAAQEQNDRTPYEKAVDRHEGAIGALAEVKKRAAEMVSAAEREAADALVELMRFEKSPGVPLPVGEQRRAEESYARMRGRMDAHLRVREQETQPGHPADDCHIPHCVWHPAGS